MCYCGSELTFDACCNKFIEGIELPNSPEQLMRSRYSAYVIKNSSYIFNTYAAEQQQANPISEISAFAQQAKFIRLQIIEAATQQVEFIAYYIIDNTLYQLHERSNFVIQDGKWRYVDGTLFDAPTLKLGRNDLCPCGSTKKYKKCHGSN